MSEFVEQKLLEAVKSKKLPSLIEWKEALYAIRLAEEALRSCRRSGSSYNMMFDEVEVEAALAAIEALGKE